MSYSVQMAYPEAVAIPEGGLREDGDKVDTVVEEAPADATATATNEETSDAYAVKDRIGVLTWADKFLENTKANFRALWTDTTNPLARAGILVAAVLASPVALAITGLLMGFGILRSTARYTLGRLSARLAPCTAGCLSFGRMEKYKYVFVTSACARRNGAAVRVERR